MPEPTQSWPLTPAIVLEDLSFERLRGIARLFRLGVAPDATWQEVRRQLLLEPAAHAIALLHLLSRKELGDVCRHVNITDEGPTQDVLARLLPLCQPGPTR